MKTIKSIKYDTLSLQALFIRKIFFFVKVHAKCNCDNNCFIISTRHQATIISVKI